MGIRKMTNKESFELGKSLGRIFAHRKERNALRRQVERLKKAMRKVIDEGLYQPESADVLEKALKGE